MIRISTQSEPVGFDEKVRIPGKKWLEGCEFYDPFHSDIRKQVPKKTKFPDLWCNISKEIHHVYHGICAYLGIYFEQPSGASSVDHFLPKTLYPGLAYEWTNYRLASLGINRKKGKREDIMDPFLVPDHAFQLNLLSGDIFPNPEAVQEEQLLVKQTIDGLDLNAVNIKEMRCRHFTEYVKGDVSRNYMQTHSPYVWAEIERQNLVICSSEKNS